MFIAMSVMALAQFGIYYWRAVMAGIAAEPVSAEVLAAAGLPRSTVDGHVFPVLAGLHSLTPRISHQSRWRESLVLGTAYYHIVRTLPRLPGLRFPLVDAWSQREMMLCARYAAVLIAYRMKSNLACSATVRSC